MPKIENVNLEKSLLIPVEVQYGSQCPKDEFQDVQLKDLVAEALTPTDGDHHEQLATTNTNIRSHLSKSPHRQSPPYPRSTDQVDSMKKEEEIISQFSDGVNRLHQGDSKFEPAEDQHDTRRTLSGDGTKKSLKSNKSMK
jgi:hypothetical protein